MDLVAFAAVRTIPAVHGRGTSNPREAGEGIEVGVSSVD